MDGEYVEATQGLPSPRSGFRNFEYQGDVISIPTTTGTWGPSSGWVRGKIDRVIIFLDSKKN